MSDSPPNTRTRLEVPLVAPELVLENDEATIIDLRSESEFADDHVPGAHSVPLFDDTERALVGTLFKRASPETAFERGAELVGRSIRPLLERIGELTGWTPPLDGATSDIENLTRDGIANLEAGLEVTPVAALPKRPVIFHCWRGGLRSQSVLGYCRMLGLDRAVGMDGGYKAYRRLVMQQLADWTAPPSYVIRGLTGVGKTLILRELERLRPGWTLDLEGCAGHRSSLLGMVGLEPSSQRTFESKLAHRLRQGFSGPCVFEGESRKVGDAIIPSSLWTALRGGVNLQVTASVEHRIRVLSEDYLAAPEARVELARQLPLIEERMQADYDLVALLEADRIDELVAVLLEHYYDPLYRHSEKDRGYAVQFVTSDARKTASEIADWIEAHPSTA